MPGEIIAGVLAPHPPHLVYASNAVQNEAQAECGWEALRWAYDNCRQSIQALKPDALIVHSPHWPTYQGHHLLGLERFQGLSVDPIFPHLFRYHYDMQVELGLSRKIHTLLLEEGLPSTLVTNPYFRVDYGSIISLHMLNPSWDIPVVVISANQAAYYYSNEIGNETAQRLGTLTRDAVKSMGKRCVAVASCSLSHRHFTHEPEIPEDMSYERIHHHGQYLWDMKILELMRRGKSQELLDIMPEFNEMATAETKAGSLSWLLAALEVPTYPAKVHGYGTVIGTGNAVVEWNPQQGELPC